MRIRIPLVLFLFISIFSCKKSEDPIVPKPIIEEPIAEDEENPELTVNGFTETIETYTTVSIDIVDESTVETKIIYDGEELATSTEKQFDVSINPYGIPVGSTDFIVVSKDAKGNEVTETFSVEIKHLLMTYDFGANEADDFQNTWLFFNRIDGSELAMIEAVVGLNKVYTDQIVSEDKVLYSRARSLIFDETEYKRLYVETYEVSLAETRTPRSWNEYVAPENTVEVQLNGVPINNGLPRFIASGPDYRTSTFDGDASFTNLTILHRANRPVYIRTNAWGSDPAFDGKKENYFYTKINPQEGNTTMFLVADALINAENSTRIEVPVHDAGSFHIFRKGAENQEDYLNYQSHQIYDTNETNGLTYDYLDLPIVSGLGNYKNSVSYMKNEVPFYSQGDDSSLDIEMPNWTASLQMTDSIVELSANNQDVDLYSVHLAKKEIATDYSTNYRFSWSYGVNTDDSGVKKIPFLVLPEAISLAMIEPLFQSADGLEWRNIRALNYEKYDSYQEAVNAFALNENVLTAIDDAFKQVTFDNPNYTDKSSKEDFGKSEERQNLNNIEIKINRMGYYDHFESFSQY